MWELRLKGEKLASIGADIGTQIFPAMSALQLVVPKEPDGKRTVTLCGLDSPALGPAGDTRM